MEKSVVNASWDVEYIRRSTFPAFRKRLVNAQTEQTVWEHRTVQLNPSERTYRSPTYDSQLSLYRCWGFHLSYHAFIWDETSYIWRRQAKHGISYKCHDEHTNLVVADFKWCYDATILGRLKVSSSVDHIPGLREFLIFTAIDLVEISQYDPSEITF
ncbi:hypothetical protein H4R34_005284 [Dimargaris verticillata]|uniref:Uncharacterized protein n=1 Tax=Dimargaris verticillata TaxID=2761393 RepID=A0A9W8B0W9_9FUNG|nr:hypothetical protein H4R34_005284 [Dimargaris verticillata]